MSGIVKEGIVRKLMYVGVSQESILEKVGETRWRGSQYGTTRRYER